MSHQSTDARWWGIKYTEKDHATPGKDVADLDGNVIGKLSSGAPSPSLDNVGIASDIFLEFQRAMKL